MIKKVPQGFVILTSFFISLISLGEERGYPASESRGYHIIRLLGPAEQEKLRKVCKVDSSYQVLFFFFSLQLTSH